jgi:hypothetical protein
VTFPSVFNDWQISSYDRGLICTHAVVQFRLKFDKIGYVSTWTGCITDPTGRAMLDTTLASETSESGLGDTPDSVTLDLAVA